MQAAEFDQIADDYDRQHRANIAITGEGPNYFARYKVARLAGLLKRLGRPPGRILDFGAGIGNSVRHFRHFFPGSEPVCADVSKRCLEVAAERCGQGFTGLHVRGDHIPCDDASFDTLFSACVFHHIPEHEHVSWLRELFRVARADAVLMVFEHNPLNPLTRHAVDTCPFDVNARLIRSSRLAAACREAGWLSPETRFHVFFPHFLAPLRGLDGVMSRLPLGGQYSVAARKSL